MDHSSHSSGMLKEYFDKVVKHYKNARLIWIVSGILFVFSVIYTVANILSINKKIVEINERYQTESPMPGNELPGVYKLRKESAFWQSRLAMAKSDSICVTIDLVDSLVFLEMQGVVVHSAPIKRYYRSELFEALKPEAILNIMGQPAVVVSHEASFSKEPIKLKKAPKDTIEANAAVVQEALDKQQAVEQEEKPLFYNLSLNNGLQITFSQEHGEGWKAIPFLLKQRIEKIEKNSLQLTKFKLPEYTPGIMIEMTREDAASIFRGLPENASVALRL